MEKDLRTLEARDPYRANALRKQNRLRERIGGLDPSDPCEPVVTAVLRGFLRGIGSLADVALKTGIAETRLRHFLAAEADLHGRDIDRIFVAYEIRWEFDDEEAKN
jgi:hypothetical protein